MSSNFETVNLVSVNGSQETRRVFIPTYLKNGDTIKGIIPNKLFKLVRWEYDVNGEPYKGDTVFVEEVDVDDMDSLQGT